MMAGSHDSDLVNLTHIGMTFSSRRAFSTTKMQALRDVSLSIQSGDTVVLVGESGSGKTTLGRIIAGLQRPTSGVALFKGRDIFRLKGESRKEYRRSIQLLHQDPYTSLNPSLTIERSLVPAIMKWKVARTRAEGRKIAGNLLQLVGLSPAEFLHKYPHQISGGQRQRVAIARCISINPRVIVLDEPVSMIDVSLRIGILDTLLEIRRQLDTAFVFVTHDFAIARYFCERAGGVGRIIVLYRGTVMEMGSHSQIIETPSNPYTVALLAATPEEPKLPDEQSVKRLSNTEEWVVQGCRFSPRCNYAQEICRREEPALLEVSPGQFSACHFASMVRAEAERRKVQAKS